MAELIPEASKYFGLISSLKSKLEGMDLREWNRIADQVTTDPRFRRRDSYSGGPDTSSVDNLPVTLEYLLPGTKIGSQEAVEVAIALGKDETIKQEAIRPLGPLLQGNLTRMHEVIPQRH